MEPAEVLKFFEADYSEMVTLRDIEFYSTCEHHIMPFSGVAHVGYIPDKRVVGISKLARLVEIFSRRLQIQERLGDEIVNAIMDHIQPRGAGVILEARHMCMVCRGVQKQQSVMLTSHLKGNFLKRPSVKEEFQKLVLNGKCL
jgi:GTP cyclohydrolase I